MNRLSGNFIRSSHDTMYTKSEIQEGFKKLQQFFINTTQTKEDIEKTLTYTAPKRMTQTIKLKNKKTRQQKKLQKTMYKDGILYIQEKTLPSNGCHEDPTAQEIMNINKSLQEAVDSDKTTIKLRINIDSLHFNYHEAKIINKRVEKIVKSGKHIDISFLIAEDAFNSINDIESIDIMRNSFLCTYKTINPNKEQLAKIQFRIINRDNQNQKIHIEHKYQTTSL